MINLPQESEEEQQTKAKEKSPDTQIKQNKNKSVPESLNGNPEHHKLRRMGSKMKRISDFIEKKDSLKNVSKLRIKLSIVKGTLMKCIKRWELAFLSQLLQATSLSLDKWVTLVFID